MASRRVGIFSGTFDPVHQGHIAFCLEVLQACGLDEVILLPERVPRDKENVTDLVHRAALLRRAVGPFPALRVSVLNTDQFTVAQTLPELQTMSDGAALTVLLGSDVVRTFLYRWDGLRTLFEHTSLAIGMRQEDTVEEIAAIMRQMEATYDVPVQYTLIESKHPAVTSSQIRNGKHTASLSPAVTDYIKQHKLYNIPKI
jgi:nicotinate-nucleotide adenylyltransferase